MSIAPGTTVTVGAASAPGASSSTTGAWFVDGLTLRGPVGIPVGLTSLNDYIALLGGRVSYGVLYDCAELFFASGGTTMWVSRVVGPASAAASVVLKDSAAANTLKVSAIGPGLDGNNLSVAVIAGSISGTYQIVVSYSGAVVETSPLLIAASDAINWGTLNPAVISATGSKWVSITAAPSSSGLPPVVAAAAALTGGLDDNASVTDAIRTTARAVFTPNMGPGQVSSPGTTSAPTYVALGQHAAANNRVAAYDLPVGNTATQNVTAANTAQTSLANASVDPSYGTFVAPYITWPGIATGTPVPSWPRSIPASAAFAALCAANDTINDCNVAAAGPNGIIGTAIGVAQSFVNSDRAAMNAAGISLFLVKRGAVDLYGYQSLASDPRWSDLANVRFRMQLVNDCQLIGDSFEFSQIDGAGKVIAAFNGALTADLSGYYAKGSLYGATPAAAFQVDTGPSVNTSATIAARQLNAILNVVMSPSAESVNISIVKYAVGQPLPSAS
jgi:hypothetical protein